MGAYFLLLLASLQLVKVAVGQAWCGKNYMSTEPVVPPGGQFPTPATSSQPLIVFRCTQAVKPYLASDALSPAGVLIDTLLTTYEVAEALPFSAQSLLEKTLEVTVSTGNEVVAASIVPLNASRYSIPLFLEALEPSTTAYNLTCNAYYGSSSLSTTGTLSYLPDPPSGSAAKIDMKTGAILAKPATGEGGDYEPIFPIGFYTYFDGYLAGNNTILDEVKAQGFNIIHPVPPYDNLTAFDIMLDYMQELGLYVMYDMRWTYLNLTSVAQQVSSYANRPNLLLWYTGDEPDGSEDPQNGTSLAYDKIYQVDGYHPISLCLNCQNYYYWTYGAGADILLQDTYMIGNNVTWSNEWNTSCTPDYGDCGCDNCNGTFFDISDRMDDFAYRDFALGWDKPTWTVPQAFGGDGEYWLREPTGQEFIVQSVIAINHGAKAVIPWNQPTIAEITAAASLLAGALPLMTPFIFSHEAISSHLRTASNIDVALWTVGLQTLLLATNTNYATVQLPVAQFNLGGEPAQVLDSGATYAEGVITFNSTGSGAFIF